MAERETEDRRVRKTKKQLRGALTSLLLEKDISRVTVRDVADLADVNRGTFYAHYSDVYDLLHQLEDDLLRRPHNHASVLDGEDAAVSRQ